MNDNINLCNSTNEVKKKLSNKNNKELHNKDSFVSKATAMLIIIIILICIIFGNRVLGLILHPTDIVVIEKGLIEKNDTVVGYIIRDENVLKGENYKNGIVQIKNEGEKVSKGSQVFRYYTNDEEEILQKIEELDIQYQKALDGEKTIFTNDIKILNRQISELIEKISSTNDLSEVVEYKKQLNKTMTKKAKIIGELSPSGSYISEILAEKEKYEKKLISNSEYVKSKKSGIVSYKIDGYEDYFSTKDFSKITEEQLENISIKTGQLVGTSSECGKIVDNFKCYIATIVDSDEARNAKVNDFVKIRLANTQEIAAQIKSINEASKDSKIIVFEIKKDVEYLINYRKVSIDIIWWSASGLKVPEASIIRENEISYVIRNRAGYTDKIPVKILKENGKFSLVDNYTTEELKELRL